MNPLSDSGRTYLKKVISYIFLAVFQWKVTMNSTRFTMLITNRSRLHFLVSRLYEKRGKKIPDERKLLKMNSEVILMQGAISVWQCFQNEKLRGDDFINPFTSRSRMIQSWTKVGAVHIRERLIYVPSFKGSYKLYVSVCAERVRVHERLHVCMPVRIPVRVRLCLTMRVRKFIGNYRH